MFHVRPLGHALKSPNFAILIAVGCVLGLNAVGLLAQETPSETLLTVDHYLDFETVGNPQISPDGSQVVYTRRWVNKMEDSFESAIWIMNIDGSRNRFLIEGSNPTWAPDGTRIAYLAEGEPDGSQIFVRWMDAEGAVSQITHEMETLSNIQWSPDGHHIYFQQLVPEKESWPVDLPARPEGATWTEAPRIVDRIHFRMDRIGFLPEGNTHLFRVPADGGTARRLTKGDGMVLARSWLGAGDVGYSLTPDGETLILDGLMTEDPDAHYRESHIFSLDLASGDVTQLTQRKGPWAWPAVSPDGRQIAFTGFDWTAQSYKSTELYVMALDGSGIRQISGDLDRDVGSLEWSEDSRGVLLHRGRPGHPERALRLCGRRRAAGDPGDAHADPLLGGRGRTGRRGTDLATGAGRRGHVRPAQTGRHPPAHARERRRARGNPPGRSRGDLVRIDRQHAGPGVDREAPGLRSVEEIPFHPAYPWRAPRDVQRGLQLSVPETTPPTDTWCFTPTRGGAPDTAPTSGTPSTTDTRASTTTT